MAVQRSKAFWRNAPIITEVLLGALSLGWAAPGLAQPAATGADANEEANASGEIIVTAQRREESLLEVPISIVAIGNKELGNRDITEASRLESIAPGLQIGRSGADPRPAIRGIYTESIQGNSDPRVGVYIDEIYQSRTSQLSVPFVDLARVEVQKGPQGTLYGRNSFGGNIALVTNKPNFDRVEGGVDLLAGNYRRLMADGYVNLPIAPGLAARFAGAVEKRDGYIKSLTTPLADYDDKGQHYLRGALRWSPPSMDDRLEIILRGSYWNEDDAGGNTFNAKAIGQFIDPKLVVAPGGTLTVGNATFTFPQGFNGRSFTGQFVPYSTFRDGIPDINGADIGILIPGPYKAFNDAIGFNKIKSYQGSLNMGLELGPVKLRSITGYTDFRANRGGDNDGTSAPFGIGYFITENKSFTQELQLLSNTKDSPLQYVIGAYYLDDKVPDMFLGVRNRTYSTASALANGQVPLYFGSNFTTLPSVPPFSNALITAPASDAYNPLSFQHTKAYAGYGQLSYTVADRLTLTGGLRYTVDKKDFASALGNRFAPAGTYLVFAPTTNFNHTCNGFTAADPSSTAPAQTVAEALITRCGKKTFKYFTYRGAVDYKLNDDTLLYASYSTGKHSGGFSYSVIPGTPDNSLPPYGTESVTAYEAGLKASLFDRRVQLTLAGFYNVYKDLQVQTSFANPNVPNSVITVAGNGARTKAPGIDFEVVARPADRLRINFSANYLHARDDPFPVAVTNNGVCDIVAPGGTCTTRPEVRLGFSGGILPNPVSNPEFFVPVLGPNGQQLVVGGVPQFLALGYNKKTRVQNQADIQLRGGVAYDIDLGSAGTLTPEVQTYFNGGYILSRTLVNFKQKSYTKTELRLTWTNAEDNLSLQAFVENLENEAVIGRATIASGGAFSGTFAPPRTYGMKLSFRY
ncbi:TonB-dependent receptor [Novosphingobium sp. Gsoil 351]|uniref:TonB-dependent receptor n=1 Tax=Novosphingobium sp. Gsoil 351 TaxID=2675225 RepID=UPI0012B4F8DA|nr:TonB-dependent receptor [Novosphingobium sp. Gsoil 351]QGN54507.1 TonB-dependent receptor plug domain-containing protein [Novosphingobium sp. Gsoil 351]